MGSNRDAAALSLGRWGLWFLMAAFFLLPLNGLRQVGGIPFGDFALGLAAVTAVLVCLLKRRRPVVPIWLPIGVTLLLVGYLLSEAFPSAESPEVIELFFPSGGAFVEGNTLGRSGLDYLLRLLIGIAILPITAAVLAPGWKPIRLLAGAWIAGVTLSCLAAWLDSVLDLGIQVGLSAIPDLVRGWTRNSDPLRQVGLAAHPNTLAISIALVAPMVMARIRNQRTFLIYLPVLGLFAVTALLTGSRSGVLTLLLATGGSLALIGDFRRTVFEPSLRSAMVKGGAVVLVAAILVGGVLLASHSGGSTGDGGASGGASGGPGFSAAGRLDSGESSANASDGSRREYLSTSLDLIAERPLTGNGFELLEVSHNIYLQPLLAGGIAAWLGFFVVILGFLREAVRLVKASVSRGRATAIALLISLSIYLVAALVITNMADRFIYLGPALILAGSVAAGLRGDQGSSERGALRESSAAS
jgi:hypothetical protein